VITREAHRPAGVDQFASLGDQLAQAVQGGVVQAEPGARVQQQGIVTGRECSEERLERHLLLTDSHRDAQVEPVGVPVGAVAERDIDDRGLGGLGEAGQLVLDHQMDIRLGLELGQDIIHKADGGHRVEDHAIGQIPMPGVFGAPAHPGRWDGVQDVQAGDKLLLSAVVVRQESAAVGGQDRPGGGGIRDVEGELDVLRGGGRDPHADDRAGLFGDGDAGIARGHADLTAEAGQIEVDEAVGVGAGDPQFAVPGEQVRQLRVDLGLEPEEGQAVARLNGQAVWWLPEDLHALDRAEVPACVHGGAQHDLVVVPGGVDDDPSGLADQAQVTVHIGAGHEFDARFEGLTQQRPDADPECAEIDLGGRVEVAVAAAGDPM
jgi:hypothetical protein